MSVDVFGRNLGNIEGSRGPPGIGFKVTADGHYDMENKKICNVAEPQQPSDVVNLETLRNIIKIEIRGIIDITTRLSTNLDDLNIIVDNHKDELDVQISQIKADILTIKESMAQIFNQ